MPVIVNVKAVLFGYFCAFFVLLPSPESPIEVTAGEIVEKSSVGEKSKKKIK